MSSAPDAAANALALAQRFHSLSLEYNNRPVVVRRGTLPSLVKLLRHATWEVRHTAAKTIELLAAHPENPEFMCREKGFVQSLFESYKESEHSDPELHRIFTTAFNHLRSALGADIAGGADVENDPDGAGPSEESSIRTVKNRPTRVTRGAATNRRVVVSVSGLQDKRLVTDLEDLLQTTRGVVSYTVDPMAQSVAIFTAMPTGTLLQLLENHEFACHVLSDDAMVDVSTGVGGTPMPSYARSLRDVDPSIQNNALPASAFRRSLVLHGAETNTLAARIAREKEEERRKSLEAQRSTVTSFLSRLAKSWW